jgi:hypothetical protein
MSTRLPLDRVTGLSLDPGANVVVRGVVTTSVDGSVFDAAMQADGLSPGALRAGGLFDLAAGGLRLVEQHPDRHEYVLASTGTVSPACAAAGVESPCLVPRLAVLAHERLKTAGELADTLRGSVELEGVIAPPVPLVAPSTLSGLSVSSIIVLVAGACWIAFVTVRRRARTALGRIRKAARETLRATRRDPTLDRVRAEVRAMVVRAADLDVARKACASRLARIDRTALERRREATARSQSPDAVETLAWLSAEQAEAARLESDLSSSVLGMDRIESALRVITLRVREHRGTRARVAGDGVEAAAAELSIRDEALDEAERALHV